MQEDRGWVALDLTLPEVREVRQPQTVQDDSSKMRRHRQGVGTELGGTGRVWGRSEEVRTGGDISI